MHNEPCNMPRGIAARALLLAYLIGTTAAGFAQDAHGGYGAGGQAQAQPAAAVVQLPARTGNDSLPAGEEQASEARISRAKS